MTRQQLPPQIKKKTLNNGSDQYKLCVDVGTDAKTGKRVQFKATYDTGERGQISAGRDHPCREAWNLRVGVRFKSYHSDTLYDYWIAICRKAKVSRIRLHDARHTCRTLMHLQGVPIAVIADWLGHVDNAFTMRTYVH